VVLHPLLASLVSMSAAPLALPTGTLPLAASPSTATPLATTPLAAPAFAPLLAQLPEAEVCGVGEDADWLCQLVFRLTGNDLLARGANALGSLVAVAAVLAGAWVLTRLGRRAVRRFGAQMERRIQERLDRAVDRGAISNTQRYRTRRLQRLQAIVGVLQGVFASVVWITAVLLSVSLLGVRLQPLLAGAGLASVVIGFGAQQLIRDVLAGIAMLIEDQYGVGDWIEVDGKIGEVERVGLRSTAMRDIDGTVHHFLNGYIQRVGNLSQHWARATLDVPLALDSDIPAAKALLHKVASDLAADPVWADDILGEPEIWGVQDLGPEGIRIRVVINTKPLRNWDVTRQLRERLKLAFDHARIRMPSQLVEIGGQRVGYAVLTKDLEHDEPDRTVRRRDRALVPPEVGPFDRTGSGPDRRETPPVEEHDHTAELRVQRGPQPRPD
jgi:small-conductance mechanosensitive channel